MQPTFDQEKANDLIREVLGLTQQIKQLEKRLEKQTNVLQAVFELMRVELRLAPAALAEKLAAVIRDKAERVQANCSGCQRPLGDKKKCMYCGIPRRAESVFDNL